MMKERDELIEELKHLVRYYQQAAHDSFVGCVAPMKKLKRHTFFASFIIFLFSAASVFSGTTPLLPTSLPLPKTSEIPQFVNVALLIDVPVANIATEGPYEI